MRTRRPIELVLAALGVVRSAGPDISPHAKEYSFYAPYDDINPFTGARQISQWDLGGTATAHRSFVRLTAEMQGSKGWLTSQQPFTMSEWSAMLELRASGNSPHLYGDGLAIWLVKAHDHIEGNVFGREDKWTGMGLFFDTFQNIDHSHHHKHPYIYAVINDGTKSYIPDAEAPDPAKQALPGAVDNSGCSYEFRYHEAREDVSVLNHTRVHLTYKNKVLKLRLQQTSPNLNKEWYNCFEMKDVELPNPGFFGVSSATGDLVDNHDIIQFVVRPLANVDNPDADYDKWEKAESDQKANALAEFDLRPPEALQRDYQRVLRAQAEAIKTLSGDVETLKQALEFQLASIGNGVVTTKKSLDAKSDSMNAVTEKMKQADELHQTMADTKKTLAEMQGKVSDAIKSGGGGMGGWSFWILFFMMIALAGVGYNRYNKLTKSHLP